MEELLEHLVRWNLHPDRFVTHRYSLEQADEACCVADEGAAGKVCIVFDQFSTGTGPRADEQISTDALADKFGSRWLPPRLVTRLIMTAMMIVS